MTGGGSAPVLRAEWTKFRTVRGWTVGAMLAVLLVALCAFLAANGEHEGGCTGPPPPGAGPNAPGTGCYVGHPSVPTGPDGEAVADSYYFLHRQLTGNGTITVEVTSLTGLTSTNPSNEAPSLAETRPGLAPWAKAGILLTPSTKQGSRYAAVMVTGGHGVHWEYDYTHGSASPPGSTRHWLRLTRTGARLTGYDSTNGKNWTQVGSATLAGLPDTVTVGLFVTSPASPEGTGGSVPTLATAAFDHVEIQAQSHTDQWRGQSIGTGPRAFYPTLADGSYHHAGASLVLSGSGDIAPAVVLGGFGVDTPGSILLLGLIVGLIVMIVIATLFITSEYRRGLIRTTFTAAPNRPRVLIAKAAVIGAVAFLTGAVAAGIAVPLGEHIATANGEYVLPASALTIVRVIAGSGALVALTAIGVLALGVITRRAAAAVTAGVVVFVLPYVVGSAISGGAEQWLFRLTPAAGFAVLGTLPRSALVDYAYTTANGYYPLGPGVGLAVLCGYAALTLAAAMILLRRRDA